MAGQNNSLSQQGSTSGVFSKINNFLGVPQKTPIVQSQPTSVDPGIRAAAGNTSGQSLAINNSQNTSTALSPGQFGEMPKPTIQKDVQGNTYQAPKPNPNVLAQQQMLNQKYGAGLVEDGITGPKTREAISKYLSTPTNQSVSPSTPKVESKRKINPPENTANINTPMGRAQGLLNTGNLTPDERLATQAVQRGLGLKNNLQFGGYADTKLYGTEPETYVANANRPDLVGRAAATKALAGDFANLYGSQASVALQAAQTAAARAQGVAGQVFNAGLNQQGSYGIPAFNPLTGEFTGGSQYGSGPEAVSNVQSIKDAQASINNIDTKSSAINNSLSQAIGYARSAGFTGNVPIWEGFKRNFGTNFLTNPAVIAFNQAISALNTQLESLGEQPINPETATVDTLTQAQETIRKNLITKKTGFQDFISNFNSGGSSGGSSGGLFDW